MPRTAERSEENNENSERPGDGRNQNSQKVFNGTHSGLI